MQDVGKSLDINANQSRQLNQLTEQIQGRYRDEYGRLNGLSDTDRAIRQQELNQRYYTDWLAGTKDIFTPQQRDRYQQLYYQYGGFNTINDPAVQKRLNITEQQRRNLRDAINWSNSQYAEIQRLNATNPQQAAERYREYQKQNLERLNNFLTPEQQRAWKELVGDPYNFQPQFAPTTTTRP